jgi:hypothetical protein
MPAGERESGGRCQDSGGLPKLAVITPVKRSEDFLELFEEFWRGILR